MKKGLNTILLVLFLISVVAPTSVALADSPHTRLGERFNLFAATPNVFQAGEPFHFAHGFFDDRAMGRFDFVLEVDGVEVEESYVERTGSPEGVLFIWVTNFPEGLPAGIYTFTGHWLGQCKLMVEQGSFPGPCDQAGEKVEVLTLSMTVEIVP